MGNLTVVVNELESQHRDDYCAIMSSHVHKKICVGSQSKFACTVGPRLSEHLCATCITKVFR